MPDFKVRRVKQDLKVRRARRDFKVRRAIQDSKVQRVKQDSKVRRARPAARWVRCAFFAERLRTRASPTKQWSAQYCVSSAGEMKSDPFIIPPRGARCVGVLNPAVVITCAKLQQPGDQ